MEITTIIGIVVAVIIILVGLRMVLRKPDDAAPSLESELHINSDCNQPVIPRHVRDQLQPVAASAAEKTGRVEPKLDSLGTIDTDTVAANAVVADDAVVDRVVANEQNEAPAPDTAEPDTINSKATDPQTEAAVQTSDESLLTDHHTAHMASQHAVIDQEGTTEDHTGDHTAETPVLHTEPEFQLNPDIETAEIQEFDADSSILDVHLHEQQRFDDESTLANAENIIALHIYPNAKKILSGDKALKVLLKYGLRYGELSCFHRYENTGAQSQLMFSVLRITDEGPAGFDLETLSTEQVQGLAFFLALPHPDVQKGFDTMVSIAGLIARETDGTVYDENNLEFTPQLKEHWRHKAIDYRPGQKV
ncbi:cell division protein ZipA C-terminal FtsZ-binding domain-containing protein [Acinetobacter sp. WZC-1]|uniref:cell division protein ZipA C-terminal FtsZ-binding domain-containing protein n=1 Tax=Acinetobacter sp. WZC-1 TaxID=3459034 RepID=UPI00403E250C